MRLRGVFQKSTTLFVNSGALAIGTVGTAGLGFIYWWVAARLFPPEAIGVAAALISVMGVIALVGDSGLGTLLTGELVRYPGREPGLVAAAISVGTVLAFSAALLFVLAEVLITRGKGPIDGWFNGVVFVVGCCLTTFSVLGDQAFVGTLRSSGKMIRQMLFSVLKLALIAVAAVVGYLSTTAILLSWVAGLLVSWIAFDLLTRGGARRLVAAPDFQFLRSLRRKVLDHYALDFTVQAPGVIMPYVVLVLLSPTINAAFVSLWMLVFVLALLPANMAMVLFPVVRARPNQSGHDVLVSLTVSLLFSLVCAALVFTYSQEILAVFNPAYPKIAGSDLRFLGFSLLGSTLKCHACALARLDNRMLKASRWFALGGLLELCFAVVGAKLGGLQGLVLGWTLAVSIEGACAAVVLASAVKSDLAPKSAPPLNI